jgi:hypothetical protein
LILDGYFTCRSTRLVGWLIGGLVGLLPGRFVWWPINRSVCREVISLAGCLVVSRWIVWLAGWLSCWLAGCLSG